MSELHSAQQIHHTNLACGTFSKRRIPGYMVRNAGDDPAKLVLNDGNAYLDTILGFGSLVRGYDAGVAECVARAIDENGSLVFAWPHEYVDAAARLTTQVLEQEAVRFVRTGSDACFGAVLLCRAVRPGLVVVVGRCYHGQWLQPKPPARGSLLELAWEHVDDREPDTWPTRFDTLSCIIYELPITPPHPDWWAWVGEAQRHHGVLFIADETVTALRFPGNRALTTMQPDLVVAGKALANGFGLYGIFGREDLLRAFEPPDPVFVSSTYAGDLAALAGAVANLGLEDTFGLGDTLHALGERLWEMLDPRFFDLESPVHILGQPSRFVFDGEPERVAVFKQECFKLGMLVDRPFVVCTAHEPHLERMAMDMNQALCRSLSGAELEWEPVPPLFSHR